jgi:DNA-binding NarL/FixJ family response regulator
MNTTRKLAVLVVEDSNLVRQRLRSMLQQLPCVGDIAEAASAPEALHELQTFRPDAAILDLRLGSGSGLDVLRLIKYALPSCKCIILSNMALPDVQETCLKSGADHFFNKAKEFECVLQIVASMAGGPSSSSSPLQT